MMFGSRLGLRRQPLSCSAKHSPRRLQPVNTLRRQKTPVTKKVLPRSARSTNDELANANKTGGLADKTVMIRRSRHLAPRAQSCRRFRHRAGGKTQNNAKRSSVSSVFIRG